MVKADGASDCPCSERTTSLSSGVYSKEEAFEGYLQTESCWSLSRNTEPRFPAGLLMYVADIA